MLFKIQLVIEDESSREKTIHEVAQFKREALSADNLVWLYELRALSPQMPHLLESQFGLSIIESGEPEPLGT